MAEDEQASADTGSRSRGADAVDERDGRKGVSDGLKKVIASGIRTVLSADDVIRDHMPREVLQYMMRQTDAAKDEVVRIIGSQTNRFLENLDIGGELQKILTSVSFEIKTEVRFIPNDQAVVPRASVKVKAARTDKDGVETELQVEPDGKPTRRGRLSAAVDRALDALLRGEPQPGEGDPEAAEAEPAPAEVEVEPKPKPPTK